MYPPILSKILYNYIVYNYWANYKFSLQYNKYLRWVIKILLIYKFPTDNCQALDWDSQWYKIVNNSTNVNVAETNYIICEQNLIQIYYTMWRKKKYNELTQFTISIDKELLTKVREYVKLAKSDNPEMNISVLINEALKVYVWEK